MFCLFYRSLGFGAVPRDSVELDLLNTVSSLFLALCTYCFW